MNTDKETLSLTLPVWGVCTIILTFQAIRSKRWWMLATLSLGSLLECGGNAVRIYGHFHSTNVSPYIAQQCILVLTPAFFAAAHFTILVKITELFNPKFIAPFKPKWLIPFFVILDVAALAVQGAGSGLAAVAEQTGGEIATVNNNGQIVTAGLAVQLAGYLAFNIIFCLFIYRATKQTSNIADSTLWNKRTKTFLAATWVSAILVLGRSCFRTAEMSKGWIGTVATTEWYYLVFDAAFVAAAVIILIIFSPPNYLPRIEDVQESSELPRTSSDIEKQGEQSSAPVGTPGSGASTLADGHYSPSYKADKTVF